MPNSKDVGPSVQIEDPQVMKVAQHVLNMMKLGVMKGIAHMIDPKAYPIASDTDSVEQHTIAYLKQRPQSKQETAKRNTQAFLEQSGTAIDNLYGSLSKVNLHSRNSVEKQVQELDLDAQVRLSLEDLNSLEYVGTTIRRRKVLSSGSADTSIITEGFSFLDLGNRPPLLKTTEDPIENKYQELGGTVGFLKKAIGGRGSCPDGKGRFQHYEGGSIYWFPSSGAHEVHGSIREKWKCLGWETSFLGYPITDESKTPDTIGRFNHFQHGSIYFSPKTGAHEVHGAIRTKWASLGWERGYLGYPVTDETKTPDTIGRFNHFQGGSIYHTPALGAHAVDKNIKDKWASLGWESGCLGYPITDTFCGLLNNVTPAMMQQSLFQGGRILWDGANAIVDATETRLSFLLDKVKCVDETDPDWPGSDEIIMGGAATSINNKIVATISPFNVDSDFDDDEEVYYNPSKEFCSFKLKDIPGWPKGFVVTIALCEEDWGGFDSYLKTIIEKIGEKVTNLVSEKTTEITGAALSSLIGALGNVVGALLGALVGWIADKLFDWIISIPEDDPFPIKSTSLVLPSVWHRWSGYTVSPVESVSTEAHGGEYQIWYRWALLG